jgi:hypothetical protein
LVNAECGLKKIDSAICNPHSEIERASNNLMDKIA